MDACEQVLTAVADALRARPAVPGLSVAFSGGMDSTVLLEAVRRVAPGLGLPPPRALHVDHGLSPEAAAWGAHASSWCDARGITLERLAVSVSVNPSGGLEAAARTARYAALAGALAPGEVLCVAHHADDQAETVLLNLLRGSGSLGTGAMRACRALAPGFLLRPLLGVQRAVLARCAREWGLAWISDPANRRLAHPRNRLRHVVLPALQAINPAAVEALCRSADLHRESAELADALSSIDLEACEGTEAGVLVRGVLTALPAARRKAVLRLWCRREGVPVPGRVHLEEMDRQILDGGWDRMPSFRLGAARLAVHGDALRLFRPVRAAAAGGPSVSWEPATPLQLEGGLLWAEPVEGAGLRVGAPLRIRFRAGGERCRPVGRRHSQTLKRLLQEYRVPVWRRQDLPLLHRDGVMVAVAGLFVCAGHEARAGESGWRIRWQPRG